MDWTAVEHAYGVASDLPGMFAALHDPDPQVADEAVSSLFGSITHQGTRYTATAPSVPHLVEAAADHDCVVRPMVLGLIAFAALGHLDGPLDWQHQRDLQADPDAATAWEAVAAQKARFRSLLTDEDAQVRAGALVILVWTGDSGVRVRRHVRSLLEGDDISVATAWTALTILRLTLRAVVPPTSPKVGTHPSRRYAESVAAFRFAESTVGADALDEVVKVFRDRDYALHVAEIPFYQAHSPEQLAPAVFDHVPARLRTHASNLLLNQMELGAIASEEALIAFLRLHFGPPRPLDPRHLALSQRNALTAAVPVLERWDLSNRADSQLWEFEPYDLPSTTAGLASIAG